MTPRTCDRTAFADIVFACFWLINANTFRHKSLEARGYKLEDIIEGRAKDEVLAKLKATSQASVDA